MLVTIVILSMVMIGFTLLFLRIWNANSFAIETGIASMIADRGVEDIVKQLREAKNSETALPPLEIADEYEIVFYADYDDDDITERMRYFVDSGTDELKLGITEPLGAPLDYDIVTTDGDPSDEVIETVANYVVNDSTGEPIFEYYDSTGTKLSTPVVVGQVTLVRILLYINIDIIRAPNNVRVESKATIRNLTDFSDIST